MAVNYEGKAFENFRSIAYEQDVLLALEHFGEPQTDEGRFNPKARSGRGCGHRTCSPPPASRSHGTVGSQSPGRFA
jgi:hypothetical protein